MTHAGGRQQGEKTVGHGQTGTQNRNNDRIFSKKQRLHRLADRGFNFNEMRFKVTGDFIAHQKGNFMKKRTEVLRVGVAITHQGQLMLDQRVVNNMQLREAIIRSHKSLRNLGKSVFSMKLIDINPTL